MQLKPDQELGAYRIVRQLGAGGMGSVYEAVHVPSGRPVALKVFFSESDVSEELRRRFRVEARLLARLDHPNLVRVLDLVEDEPTGCPYFAMDLVLPKPGEPRTLAEVTADAFDEKVLLRWFGELASALDYVHAQGIVHRDVKLGNVLLDAEGHAVLSDFGISHLCSSELRREVDAAHTLVVEAAAGKRLLMGTTGYFAPELARGEVPTAAVDVYALGVLFIYLLTGLWYVPGSKVLGLLAELDLRWDEVLPPMVAAEPSARPQDLVALARLLSVGRFTAKFWKSLRHKLSLLVAALVGGIVVTLIRLVFDL